METWSEEEVKNTKPKTIEETLEWTVEQKHHTESQDEGVEVDMEIKYIFHMFNIIHPILLILSTWNHRTKNTIAESLKRCFFNPNTLEATNSQSLPLILVGPQNF